LSINHGLAGTYPNTHFMRRLKYSFLLVACLLLLFSQLLHAQLIHTFAGSYTSGSTYSGDGGPATAAGLKYPYCVATDGVGNIYIGEGNNVIRKVNAAGIISTVAGTGVVGYTGDGGPATAARLHTPVAIAADPWGNIYFADLFNYVIRKVDASGIMTTVAGTGISINGGDGVPATAAGLIFPYGVAVDAVGNLYIADHGSARVRKVNAAGIISTFAGTGTIGYTGDGGPATSARISHPAGLTFDAAGNLYVAETVNNIIRKVSPSGIISTVAGSGSVGYSGDGGPATLATMNDPIGVAVDLAGNIYISEYLSHVVRQVDSSGTIISYAGTTVSGYSGDGGPANVAQLHTNWGVAVDGYGRLYIADEVNHVIRRVNSVVNCPPVYPITDIMLRTCENTSVNIDAHLTIEDPDAGQTETWTIISPPSNGTLMGFSATSISTGSSVSPSGLTYTPTSGFFGLDSFKINISDGIASINVTKFVTVWALPDAGLLSGADTVCEGDTVTLSSTASGGEWSRSNASATVVGGVVAGVSAGIDTVFYVVSNSCGIDTAWKTIYVLSTTECAASAADYSSHAAVIKVFPSPSCGSFRVLAPGNTTTITLTDIEGRIIEIRNVQSMPGLTERLMFFDRIRPGNYVLKAIAGDQVFREKLTVW
jgi:sugar lactone lactonase YvrE